MFYFSGISGEQYRIAVRNGVDIEWKLCEM